MSSASSAGSIPFHTTIFAPVSFKRENPACLHGKTIKSSLTLLGTSIHETVTEGHLTPENTSVCIKKLWVDGPASHLISAADNLSEAGTPAFRVCLNCSTFQHCDRSAQIPTVFATRCPGVLENSLCFTLVPGTRDEYDLQRMTTSLTVNSTVLQNVQRALRYEDVGLDLGEPENGYLHVPEKHPLTKKPFSLYEFLVKNEKQITKKLPDGQDRGGLPYCTAGDILRYPGEGWSVPQYVVEGCREKIRAEVKHTAVADITIDVTANLVTEKQMQMFEKYGYYLCIVINIEGVLAVPAVCEEDCASAEPSEES